MVTVLLRAQLLNQRLRLLQIARVKALSKPPVNRRQQFARLLHLALVTPEACEAHCGAQLEHLRVLASGEIDCVMKASLGSLSLLAMRGKPLPLHAAQLRLEPSFADFVSRLQRAIDEIQRLISLIGAFVRLRK